MKIIVLILMIFSQLCFAQKINIYSKKINSFLQFVLSVTDNNQDPTFKIFLEKSSVNKDELVEPINNLKNIRSYLKPKNKKDGIKIINRHALHANTLEDLYTRITHLFKIEAFPQIKESIKKLMSAYEELVWKRTRETRDYMTGEITKLISKRSYKEFLKQTRKFFDSKWPENIEFNINLIPNLSQINIDRSFSFHQEVFVNFNSLARNPKDTLVLITEEIIKQFYLLRSENTQNLIKEEFQKSLNSSKTFAQSKLPTVLNKLISRGIYYRLVQKRENTLDWIYEKELNQIAKGLYGKVNQYFIANRTFDKYIIQDYLKIVEEKAPLAHKKFKNVFHDYLLLTTKSELNRKLIDKLGSSFEQKYEKSYLGDKKLSKILNEYEKKPKIILVDEKSKYQLENLNKDIKNIHSDISKTIKSFQSSIISKFDHNKNPILFIKIKREEDISKVIDNLKERVLPQKGSTYTQL